MTECSLPCDHSFPEEREFFGRLILAPCLSCGVNAADAMNDLRQERDGLENIRQAWIRTDAESRSAVASREKAAAVKALREAAKDADCYAEDTMEHLGHHEGLLADAIRLRVVRWLQSRADQIEKGTA